MSLPVSQYEELLAEVRGLRRKAQRVQQLARPLLQSDSSYRGYNLGVTRSQNNGLSEPLDYTMESLLLGRQNNSAVSPNYDHGVASSIEGDATCSEDEYIGATSTTKLSVSSEPVLHRNRAPSSLYHGTWPVEKTMWNSEPASLGTTNQEIRGETSIGNQLEVNSVMSFASSSGGAPLDRVLGSPEQSKWSSQQLEAKMDVVHRLLSMLGSQDHIDMGETLLALSTCPESCLAMRQSGCIPLLVQLVQSDRDGDTRKKAAQALHNLVNSQSDEKLRKRESRVLKLLEQCRSYTEALRKNLDYEQLECSTSTSEDGDKHPVQTVAHLMKLSFDEGHRQAICQLGGIHTIASMVEAEHVMHGSTTTESHCILMRRYACMALTNLTFGDSGNKALLCSFREFMRALVIQLQSPSDELRQVTASVLRNLSWRADSTSKDILREVGSVTGLMKAAMLDNKENTLKSILSALWNLSAHCTENKSEICAIEGALGFLVDMLTYKTPSKSLAIIENSGGILRNISSQIAVREDYREILRNHNCLQILLDQLKSPSLTIVSNACGTLWNLSAKCAMDQEALWQMGAPSMLRSLNHSKHKMIAMGSSAALKNLLSARPQQSLLPQMDSTALSLDLPALPTLGARKQKALLQDLDQSLSETYENIEKDSPVKRQDKEGTAIDFTQDSRRKQKCISPEYLDSNLNSNFASLNLNEPSTSFKSEPRPKSRIPQNFGSSSLPYVRTNPRTYIPVRNNFSDCAYEDEIDATDQPIDFSQKYSETKLPNSDANNVSSSTDRDYSYQQKNIYAETDLDQPTDYSLRYAEDDSDSDICGTMNKNEPQGYMQDTVKTYCTEDTPYETPFNFSTATSMSDLRVVDDKQVIDNDKIKESPPVSNKEVSENIEEKERCSTEDISEIETRIKPTDKLPKSEFSSGLMSPEKPVNYCEEGTPGYFSRVSSFGSLNSIPVNESGKESKEKNGTPAEQEPVSKVAEKSAKIPPETKAVKFERVVNYAEETPLMFSRSSSLASLDSIEQHSIHDDRSSVVSDFSRLTSGIVSPSELPDSPTQTVPPSPKPRKTSLDFPSGSKARPPLEGRPQPSPRTSQKSSIFEDKTKQFKEESTPVQFSTATSLSSLTIDDHEEATAQLSDFKKSDLKTEETVIKEEEAEKKDSEKETSSSDANDEFIAESEDEGDADILEACINMGMQTNRHTRSDISASSTPNSKLPMSNYKFVPKPTINSSIPLPRSSPRTIPQTSTSRQSITQPVPDTLRVFCTEDTPAGLSHAGSNSDLSMISGLNETSVDSKGKKGDYLSDDSSNLSGDNDNILAECIQSGMPKPKKEPPKPVVKPATALPRRTNPTGRSSPTPNPNRFNNSSVKDSNPRQEARKVSVGRREQSLPPYSSLGDELENYAVENSPCQFSLRSSLSDLTVDGSVAGLKRSGVSNGQSQCSSLAGQNSATTVLDTAAPNAPNVTTAEQDSRRESLSSVSVESLGSIEAEQALLEQCISSGKPKSTCVSPTKNIDGPNSRLDIKTMGKPQMREYDDKPKNVSAASVARSTATQANEACPDMSTPAAGVEENQEPETGTKISGSQDPTLKEQERIETQTENHLIGTSPDRCLLIEEISLGDLTKNGSSKSLSKLLDSALESIAIEDCLARSCEDSKAVDNRMLDPDAMIESLDRFTAELVSQASHLNKEEDKYKMSTGDNTWNEDASPSEVTFPSISGSAPNVITFSNEDDSNKKEQIEDLVDGVQEPSNDFSSINTSTMTDSTLIAIEASKMATVFKNEAEMSLSITSAASLELDHVPPPFQLNSLTNSAVGLEKIVPRSPKLVARKKSLPAGLMVRRALSNSLNHGSSLESLENHSLSNLDHVNPPSELMFDLEGSMTSVASLPHEYDMRTDFVINGILHKETSHSQHPIFDIKQPFTASNYGCNELENINPPSLFNEITDFCNSLADVPTEAICGDSTAFEDCLTHVIADEDDVTCCDDVTEFATPPQSSSSDTTPKKQSKSLSKSMTTKQRRNLARDRYKTYTVAAEMVMREAKESEEMTEDYRTARDDKEEDSTSTYVSPTYSVSQSKLTPKEKRQMNRSRFETQVVDTALTNVLQQPVIDPLPLDPQNQSSNSNSCSSSPAQSPARTKLSIRRNFMQKRLENKDRFRTQTLSESSFSPDISSSASPPLNGETDVQLRLQKEADIILRTLRDSKTTHELLDCETLSLVSNDDDSEHNSGGSVNYRTYHKSWGIRKINIPVISSEPEPRSLPESNFTDEGNSDGNSNDEEPKVSGKPKIVKPSEKPEEPDVEEEQVKVVRGRRKPLYSKSNVTNKIASKSIKPARTVMSNLVKNVTSTLKSSNPLKPTTPKPNTKTPAPAKPAVTQSRISSGYGNRPLSQGSRMPTGKTTGKQTPPSTRPTSLPPKGTPPMERQGTFTKDNLPASASPKRTTTSRIPAPSSAATRIPTPRSQLPTVSKTPSSVNLSNSSKPPAARNGYVKSASSDRTTIKNPRIYNRSTSADSREPVKKIQQSPSSQSLKMQNGAVKKSSIPSLTQRSNSNTSINSSGSSSTSAKKQVTSKIASLWKRIEDTKKQPPKKDTRLWIQPEPEPDPPRLIRSNTFDNKDGVILRNRPVENGDSTKRVSRLGSFVLMDENEIATNV